MYGVVSVMKSSSCPGQKCLNGSCSDNDATLVSEEQAAGGLAVTENNCRDRNCTESIADLNSDEIRRITVSGVTVASLLFALTVISIWTLLPDKTLEPYVPSLSDDTDVITFLDYPLPELFEWLLLWMAKVSITLWVIVLFMTYLLTGQRGPVFVILLMLLCIVSVPLSMVFLLD